MAQSRLVIRVCQFGKHGPQAGSESGIGSPEFAGHDGNGGGQGTTQFRLAADGRRMRLGTDPPSRRVPLMSWSGHAARMADPVPVVAVSRSGTSATHVDAAFTPADLIEAWSEQLGEEARDVHGCPHRWKRR